MAYYGVVTDMVTFCYLLSPSLSLPGDCTSHTKLITLIHAQALLLRNEWTPEPQNLRLLSQRMKGETLGSKGEKAQNKKGSYIAWCSSRYLIVFLHTNLSHYNFLLPQHTALYYN